MHKRLPLPFSCFLCKEKLHLTREVSTISGLELKLPGWFLTGPGLLEFTFRPKPRGNNEL